jgi:hypothetical protein
MKKGELQNSQEINRCGRTTAPPKLVTAIATSFAARAPRYQRIVCAPTEYNTSISYSEWRNPTMQIQTPRFTQLSNAFSKEIRQPLSRSRAIFRVLQFRSHPQGAQTLTRDGGGASKA